MKTKDLTIIYFIGIIYYIIYFRWKTTIKFAWATEIFSWISNIITTTYNNNNVLYLQGFSSVFAFAARIPFTCRNIPSVLITIYTCTQNNIITLFGILILLCPQFGAEDIWRHCISHDLSSRLILPNLLFLLSCLKLKYMNFEINVKTKLHVKLIVVVLAP